MTNYSKSAALFFILLTTATFTHQTSGGIIVMLDDNGSGGTSGTITGTFDISSGSSIGGSGVIDIFGGPNGPFDLIWSHNVASKPDSRTVLFGASDNTSTIANGSIPFVPSQLVIDGFQLDLDANGARITDFGSSFGPRNSNESFDYTATSFGFFNAGTWNWGGGSTTTNGITLQVGAAAVPEPSSFAIFGAGFVMIGFYRRRRNRRCRALAPMGRRTIA